LGHIWSDAFTFLYHMTDSSDAPGTQFVGSPEEFVRAVASRYVDSARADFAAYISSTLSASMRAGGRYNPIGEFGAVYCADSTETMWKEVANRYAKEGVLGLPERMGVLRLLVSVACYTDLRDADVCRQWEVDPDQLVHGDATYVPVLHEIARRIRAVADFIAAPSARDDTGTNYAVFPDRSNSTLEWGLVASNDEPTPVELRQKATQSW
jgi:RES domain-containing protein